MTHRRGDVVLVWYPHAAGIGGSRRPALIVQNDADNKRLRNTIVAQITTNLSRASESTHLLVSVASLEGKATGLLHDSLVSCNNLATIEESLIQRKVGRLGPSALAEVDACLVAALGIP